MKKCQQQQRSTIIMTLKIVRHQIDAKSTLADGNKDWIALQ